MQTLAEAAETFQVPESKAEFKPHIQINIVIVYLKFANLGLKTWV